MSQRSVAGYAPPPFPAPLWIPGSAGAGPSSEDEEGASEDSEGEGYDRSDEEEDDEWSRTVARDEACGAAFDELRGQHGRGHPHGQAGARPKPHP